MRYLLGAAFAAGLLLVSGNATWAQDTLRLGGPSAQADIQGGTDTELVHRRGGYYGGYRGGFYGGNRGFYGGGFRGGYYGGGFGRGYYGAGYRPYFYGANRGYYGFYQPYYGAYRPYYYASYYSPYYSDCSDYPYYGSYYSTTLPIVTQAVYQTPATRSYMPPATEALPAPNPGGTFPYDGGPREPVPVPNRPIPPATNPVLPIDGKLVALPTETGGGMSMVSMTPRSMTTTPARINYPAYGEEPFPAVPRKR